MSSRARGSGEECRLVDSKGLYRGYGGSGGGEGAELQEECLGVWDRRRSRDNGSGGKGRRRGGGRGGKGYKRGSSSIIFGGRGSEREVWLGRAKSVGLDTGVGVWEYSERVVVKEEERVRAD
ncbi:hypothetical protein Tco_1438558 [Tanacetum coccineum]